MTRVLVVDDEPHLVRALTLNLTSRGFDVTTASTAALALAQFKRDPPDLVLLDLGLPDRDGLDVIRDLLADGVTTQIVVLSARNGSQDKVTALDLGAVDYVTKPFDMNELIARLRAVTRRANTDVGETTVRVGDVDIDFRDVTARRPDGSSVHLTRTEWRILEVLVRQPGRLITARELLTAVRGDPEHTEGSYLRIYLAQLRRKLEPEPARPRHLLTEPGMGYRFRP
jgi:two-component system, OmpR family, KDP operon response regulator KdpE